MKLKRFFLLFVLAFLIALPTGLLIARLEGNQPTISTDLVKSSLGRNATFSVHIADPETGIRNSRVSLLIGNKEVLLDQQSFPNKDLYSGGELRQKNLKITVNPKSLGLNDGKATLRFAVQDYSWRNWGAGNKTISEMEILIDTQTPEIFVLSRAHNIAQGGTGLVVFQVSEECHPSGVMVGNSFFPGYSGYFENPLIYIAFFALNYDQGPETQLYLSASDLAGNQGKVGFTHHINKRHFKKDQINISDNFLRKVIPEFSQDVNDDTLSEVEKYIYINRYLRKDNDRRIYEATKQSDSNLYWKGSFLRLPKAATRAGYGEHRNYFYNGNQIDQQVHLGVDLASEACSPVPAANAGKIVFAEKLGIYGLAVIVDHGFGLFSLYSHLSQLRVSVGQSVEKGQFIGDTGTSGLALGDHLHFSMLVHKTFVNPIEWWDAQWIQNNITVKLTNERLR